MLWIVAVGLKNSKKKLCPSINSTRYRSSVNIFWHIQRIYGCWMKNGWVRSWVFI